MTPGAASSKSAQFVDTQTAADIRALLSDKLDSSAPSTVRLSDNLVYHAELRTTCVATMLQGGHAR